MQNFSSKISKIYIELNDFQFFHSPSGIHERNKHFIGRVKLIKRIKSLLKDSATSSGAYLITGYRGMGKSSLINEALRELLKDNSSTYTFLPVTINIGHDDLREIDIFKQIVKNLSRKFHDFWISSIKNVISWFVVALIFIIAIGYPLGPLISENFSIFFETILVGGISLFLALIFLVFYLDLFKHNKIIAGYQIISKLRKLKRTIYYQQSQENNIEVAKLLKIVGLKFGKQRSRSTADTKEIERELISIIEKIANYKHAKSGIKLVFIFDELDKIEPQNQLNSNQETETEDYIMKQNILYSPEVTRKRLNQVFHMLANIKYFLSTAQAKFLFIGGRELYDAALADISDRDYFVRSIFHDVIYVDSFLSDPSDGKPSDISSMTEAYVVQFLMPLKNNVFYSLQDYNKELNDNLLQGVEDKEEKRQKIIVFLKQFINYLTHVSNGAPNRLKNSFEQFIVKQDEIPSDALVITSKDNNFNNGKHAGTLNSSPDIKEEGKKKKSTYFLGFNYFSQYRVGIFNYLVSPFQLAFSNSVKDYGDKILISSSFLIDRLLKYHNHGFSWRLIELSPEIIDINKTPELRNFVARILNHLSETHIQEIVNGLYTFRFPQRISQELSYASKISEEASAAFNFTMDETLGIKQIYYKQLEALRLRHNKYEDEQKSKFVHSIAAIHAIIAELHFLSEELNDAILEYKESIQYLRNMKQENMTPEHLLLLIRNMLKLGLAFEKRKTYDSAFSTYGRISFLLLDIRNISEDNYGLLEKRRKEQVVLEKETEKQNFKEIHYNFLEPPKANASKYYTLDNFLDKLTQYINSSKAADLFKISVIEGVRIIYQPLLAKFQIIEKNNIGGATYIDLKRLISEFNFLTRVIKKQEKSLIISDFWSKLAHILYFKNGVLCNVSVKRKRYHSNQIKNCFMFRRGNLPFSTCVEFQKLKYQKNQRIPCTACHFSFRSLAVLLTKFQQNEQTTEKTLHRSNKKFVIRILKALHEDDFASNRHTLLATMAGLLSDIGNTFYSCSGIVNKDSGGKIEKQKKEELNSLKDYLQIFLGYMGERFKKEDGENYDALVNKMKYANKFEEIITFYWLSSEFYGLSKDEKSSAYQLTKIVYFIRDSLKFYFRGDDETYKKGTFIYKISEIRQIENVLLSRFIHRIYEAYNFIHLTEIYQLKEMLNLHENNLKNDINLNYSSISSEIEEIKLVFEDFRLENLRRRVFNENHSSDYLEKNSAKKNFLHIYRKKHVSKYTLNTNMYNRILQLNYKADQNHLLMKLCGVPNADTVLYQYPITKFFYELLLEMNNEDHKFAQIICNQLNQEDHKTNSQKGVNPDEVLNLIEFLINDSIFCYINVIRQCQVFGFSFGMPYSVIAEARYKLMMWKEYYKLYLMAFDIIQEKNNKINSITLKSLIDEIDFSIEQKTPYVKDLQTAEIYNNFFQIDDYPKERDNFQTFINKLKRRNNKSKSSAPWANKKISKKDKELIFKEIKETFDFKNTESLNNISPEKIKDRKENFEKDLEKLIGKEFLSYISGAYQAGKAMNEFKSAISTHNQGKSYKEFLQHMYYLKNDFSDKYSHFSAAKERFKINSGWINKRLKKIELYNLSTKLYDYNKYISFEE